MNVRIRLALLAALDASLTVVGRYGGGVGGWVDALSRPAVAVSQALARREAAVDACVRALQGLEAPAQAAALLELLQRLEGLPAELCAAQYLIAALEGAALRGLAHELDGAARVVA